MRLHRLSGRVSDHESPSRWSLVLKSAQIDAGQASLDYRWNSASSMKLLVTLPVMRKAAKALPPALIGASPLPLICANGSGCSAERSQTGDQLRTVMVLNAKLALDKLTILVYNLI